MAAQFEQHRCTPRQQSDEAVFFNFLESVFEPGGWDGACTSPSKGSDVDAYDTLIIPKEALPQSPSDGFCDHDAAGVHLVNSKPLNKLPRKRQSNTKRAPKRCSRAISVRRCISNDTYLRRLYLSQSQAVALFPFVSHNLLQTPRPRLRGRSQKLTPTFGPIASHTHNLELVDEHGDKWPANFECSWANGKLYCLLAGGWAQFCRHNKVAVSDYVVLQRGQADSTLVFVRIERA